MQISDAFRCVSVFIAQAPWYSSTQTKCPTPNIRYNQSHMLQQARNGIIVSLIFFPFRALGWLEMKDKFY